MARPGENLNNIIVSEIPSTIQQRFEYNADGTVKYAGSAIRGASASSQIWTLHKFTYSSGLLTLRQTAFGSWDERSTAIYA